MSIKIKLTAQDGKGVDFNNGYKAFFTDFVPSSSPEFLGPTERETTQIVHLATPEAGKEAQARAVLLDGDDFLYTFSNHTVSGELDSLSLVTLGKAYDAKTGELVLNDGIVTTATPYITFSDLDLGNPAGEAGPVHKIVAGLMGGGPSGTKADASAITRVIWSEAHDVSGSTGADRYAGTAHGDTVRGQGGNDTLLGRGGADRLFGGAGADKLTGGAGADQLSGGSGADTFVFNATLEAKDDLVRDFSLRQGDVLKLSAIDADTTHSGNQTFSFIGTDAFGGEAGELRYKAGAAKTVVVGDTDGDGAADFWLTLSGHVKLSADDFIL